MTTRKDIKAGEASLGDYIAMHEAEKAAWLKVLGRLTNANGWTGPQETKASAYEPVKDPIMTPSEWSQLERDLFDAGKKSMDAQKYGKMVEEGPSSTAHAENVVNRPWPKSDVLNEAWSQRGKAALAGAEKHTWPELHPPMDIQLDNVGSEAWRENPDDGEQDDDIKEVFVDEAFNERAMAYGLEPIQIPVFRAVCRSVIYQCEVQSCVSINHVRKTCPVAAQLSNDDLSKVFHYLIAAGFVDMGMDPTFTDDSDAFTTGYCLP